MYPFPNDGALQFSELGSAAKLLMNQLHYGALLFMIVAYSFKLWQLLRLPAVKEGTPPRGDHKKGVRYAYMTLAMPWELESYRKKPVRYVEFAFFHIATAFGIGMAFVTPIAHELMREPAVVYVLQISLLLGALAGVSRLVRRFSSPAMRAISHPDDYFSLALLTVWFAAGVVAAPQVSETWLVIFFALATFFLVYVPFSKISHYLYWPFVRFYMGKHFGHRGVYPKKSIRQANLADQRS